MKMHYIKPVCEIEEFLTIQSAILSESNVTGELGGEDMGFGFGGEDDGTHDPDVKGQAWDFFGNSLY